MKITKRQLKRIIKEERSKLLNEYSPRPQDVRNPTVDFAQAWASLGSAIQEQMVELYNGYAVGFTEEAAGEINPDAFDRAKEKLVGPLRQMRGQDAQDLLDMFQSVSEFYEEYGV